MNAEVISDLCLQEQYAPRGVCYGCGRAHPHGLQIQSFVKGETVVAKFVPANHHHGFEGILNGGIIGALFDCHMNWTAAWSLMQAQRLKEPPCTVTGNFQVQFHAPTPMDTELQIEARAEKVSERKAEISVTLTVNDVTTASGTGVFIAVKEGHPAFNRWN